MWKRIRTFVVSIAMALAVGGLAALLTRSGMDAFGQVRQPAWSPPMWLFPIVWTVLFTLMGVSAALVYRSGREGVPEALRAYLLQLVLNFGWTVLYFGFGLYLAAFFWLLVLLAVIIVMIVRFWRVVPAAGALQLPYALWVAFAGALNLAVALMN